MNRLLLAVLPMLMAAPVVAGDTPAPSNSWNGPQTRADAEARAEMLFSRLDANHDGFVAQDEVDQFAKAMDAQTGGDTNLTSRIARRMAEADADHDGKITPVEAKASADRRFDAADTNHDGTITPEERQTARAAGQAQPPQQ
jgi:Ca2+-binding EF-hand superfamily protein